MKIESAIICRAGQNVYEKLIISDFEPGLTIAPYMSQEEGVSPLPCKLYHLQGSEYVSVYPDLPIESARYAIGAFDAQGKRIDATTHTLDYERAKWGSRINYRMRKQACAEIRLIDERLPENGIWGEIKLHQVISTTDHIQFRMHIRVQGTCAEKLKLAVLDANGNCVADSFIMLGQVRPAESTQACEDERLVTASVSLPWDVNDIYVMAWNEAHPERFVRAWFGKQQWNAMREAMDNMLYKNAGNDPYYNEWFKLHRISGYEANQQRNIHLPNMPLFSVIVPLYKTPINLFEEMLGSLKSQTYGNWECILVNSTPEDAELSAHVSKAAKDDSRIRVVTLEKNLGISLNTNAGTAVAKGDYICFFDHDDTIECDLLFEYARAINKNPAADLLYCDEDKLGEDGRYCDPFFKSDFSIDHLRHCNYICHMLCIRKTMLDQLEPNTPQNDGSQDHNLTLQVAEKSDNIVHVGKVLYHWRKTAGSTAATADAKEYAIAAGVLAVQNHLDRLGINAKVKPSDEGPFRYDVQYALPTPEPLVSIIIPNKDHIELLKPCIDSILGKSTYGNYEIIVVENNSAQAGTFAYYDELENTPNIKVVRYPEQGFNFSKVINFGRSKANGDYLLLLNNDTEVITADWLERMVSNCARSEVGAVGACLYYPDSTIQHAGLVFGNEVQHSFKYIPRARRLSSYFGHATIQRNVSAVTGACFMTRAERFDELGGFDSEYAVAFNDVDYCFKVRQSGKLIVYLPEVELFHYESISRGSDDDPENRARLIREFSLLKNRWSEVFAKGDPYFTKNINPAGDKVIYYAF